MWFWQKCRLLKLHLFVWAGGEPPALANDTFLDGYQEVAGTDVEQIRKTVNATGLHVHT